MGLTLLAQACGKYDRNSLVGAAGHATTDASGGASSDSAAGASAQVAGQQGEAGSATALEQGAATACIAYATAVCRRQAECSGFNDRCLETAAGECPDLVFSPGATRTVEGLLACAKDYATWPCDDVKSNVLPPCVTPGTRAQGEPCDFPSQCKSRQCETHGGCGQCAKTVDIGESCAAPDVACAGTSSCGASGICLPMTGPLYFAGQPCTVDWPCESDYYCQGVCLPLPKIGESCEALGDCVYGAYCGPDGSCLAVPGVGEPCGFARAGKPNAYYCEPGLGCNVDPSSMTGTCLALPQLGEPCLLTGDSAGNQACDPALHCDDAQSPGTCIAIGAAGTTCHSVWDCQGDLACACPTAEPDCKLRKCASPRVEGERCDEPNTACHAAFRCEAGICTQRGLRSIFADACGG
jgi:hypothetical protein